MGISQSIGMHSWGVCSLPILGPNQSADRRRLPSIRLHQYIATFAPMTTISFHPAIHLASSGLLPSRCVHSCRNRPSGLRMRSRAYLLGAEGGRYVELQPLPPRPPLTTMTSSSANAWSLLSGSGHHPSTFKRLIQLCAAWRLCRTLQGLKLCASMYSLFASTCSI